MHQKKIKVFIADDHPVVGVGIESILKTTPNQIPLGLAETSSELFRALPQVLPDILLLDLNMPGNNFIRNLQRLRKEFPQVKVIIYSAYSAPEIIRSLLEEGVRGFLPKSSPPGQLVEAINRVFEGKKYIGVKDQLHQAPSDGEPKPGSLLPNDFRKRLRLSKREREILVLISKGLTSQGIGKALFISKHTVETHRKNILRKLELNSSTELVKFAFQQGLV